MGWYSNGDNPRRRENDSGMPGGHKVVLILMGSTIITIMAVFIAAFGLMGLFYGIFASLLFMGFIGTVFGGY